MRNIWSSFSRKIRMLFLDIKNFLGFKYTVFRLPSGQIFRIRNIDKVGRKIFDNTSFEKRIICVMLSRIREGMTVVDVGANIGYYSLLMSQKVGFSGKVVSFEPNSSIFKEFEHNLKINKITNVIAERVAISSETGYQTLLIPCDGMEAHASFNQNETFTTSRVEMVRTEKLDDALGRFGIEHVDLIKIDVEGAEKSVFEGASKMLSAEKGRPAIIFECSEMLCEAFGHRVYDVLNFLRGFGYSVKEISFGVWLADIDNKKLMI